MPVLDSTLDVRSDEFLENRRKILEMLATLDELHKEVAQGGGEEAMARLASRGKMPIRERIALVLDRDSPFMEISPLAAWRSNFNVGSGFVVGLGVIEDTECLILGHDPSVRAGAFNQFNAKKLMRGLEIARENRLPMCNLSNPQVQTYVAMAAATQKPLSGVRVGILRNLDACSMK